MEPSKKGLKVILSIVIAGIVIIGGVVFFSMKRQREMHDSLIKRTNLTTSESKLAPTGEVAKKETTSIAKQNISIGPKEVYLDMIAEMERIKTFEEWYMVARKYSDTETNQKIDTELKTMTADEKNSLFYFARVFLPAKANIKEIKEEIVGNNAILKVQMVDGKTTITANMKLENGMWKVHQESIRNPLMPK